MGKTTTYNLTHRVTIQYNAAAGQTDSNGERKAPELRTLATVFADRSGMKGYLKFAAAMSGHEDDEMFVIYWRPDVRAGMLFIENGEAFELKVPPFDPDGTRMWLECHCRRLTAGGS